MGRLGGRGGMQTNVAKALGFTPGQRAAPESVTCSCGKSMIFDTDDIGRLVQRCPTGRCYRGHRRVSPDGVDVMNSAREKRLIEEAKAERVGPGTVKLKVFSERPCELPECGKAFTPNSPTQRFCSQLCGSRSNIGKASTVRRGQTLGIAGTYVQRED